MKKLVYLLVLVVSVSTLSAGGDGKSCGMKKKAKSVELTGQLVCKDGSDSADCERVFRVANAENTTYSVCDESKVDVEKLSNANLRISGKLIQCREGEELVIEKASKI